MTEPMEDEKTLAHLQLFVVGDEPHSKRARENIVEVLGQFEGHYEFEVIDVLKNYRTALDAGILIAPTLLITTSNSRITIAGDMEDRKRLVGALKLIAE